MASASTPQLQAFLYRPKHLSDRHLDDPRRNQLAGVSAHWLRIASGPRRLCRADSNFSARAFCRASGSTGWTGGRCLCGRRCWQALQSLALAGLTLARVINIHEIIWLSVLQGLINAFDMPGRQAFLVQMVEDKQDLGNAIALNSSMVNMARLVGPALAGFVIARRRRRILLRDRRRQLSRRHRFTADDAVNIAPAKRALTSMLRTTQGRLDLCFRLSPDTNHSVALRADQPDGDALHGAHAHLRIERAAWRTAYARIPAGSVRRRCVDLRSFPRTAQDGPRTDDDDPDFSRALRCWSDLFWPVANPPAIDVPHADRRLSA